jgi:hypothetical protein
MWTVRSVFWGIVQLAAGIVQPQIHHFSTKCNKELFALQTGAHHLKFSIFLLYLGITGFWITCPVLLFLLFKASVVLARATCHKNE